MVAGLMPLQLGTTNTRNTITRTLVFLLPPATLHNWSGRVPLSSAAASPNVPTAPCILAAITNPVTLLAARTSKRTSSPIKSVRRKKCLSKNKVTGSPSIDSSCLVQFSNKFTGFIQDSKEQEFHSSNISESKRQNALQSMVFQSEISLRARCNTTILTENHI